MKRLIGLIALTLVVARMVAAGELSPQQLFSQGMSAFQQGDFQTALQRFQHAQQQGLVHSHLQYNLGVTYYKLGQYNDAITALQSAAIDKQLAVFAYFNTGLAQLKLNDETAARRSFELAYASTQDRKQKAWLQQSVEQLNLPKAQKLSAQTRIDMGFNDNVRLQDDVQEIDRQQDDNFYALSSSVDWPLNDHFSAGISLYGLDYWELNEFDYMKYGVHSTLQWGGWRIKPAVNFALLDQDSFFNHTDIILEKNFKLTRQSIEIALRGQQYSKLAQDYQHLKGNVAQAWIELRRPWRRVLLHAGYLIESNNRDNVIQDGNLIQDFSPLRHLVYIKGKWRFKQFYYQLSGGYRLSQYEKDQDTLGLNPRQDARTTLQFNISRAIGRGWWMLLDSEWLNNDSNVDSYSFDSSRVSLGLVWSY